MHPFRDGKGKGEVVGYVMRLHHVIHDCGRKLEAVFDEDKRGQWGWKKGK
jgi:hypothetical protein